ncbi:effector binding domain-containing protein [Paenibacillus sp. FSL H8-0332]|uniref:effector binding domain-containing protein n=1 Tax=Paenibacillus sp. FSL H8-0332 TaxID=2954742 RepID=UPI0030CB64E3
MITTQLSKIGEVSSRYGISSRTLRYYEEIGLIASIREPSSAKRLYSQEMLRRLELILLLKQLSFSVKDITAVLLASELSTAVGVFCNKLGEVQREISNMLVLRELLERYVELLQAQGVAKGNAIGLLLEQSKKLNLDVAAMFREGELNIETEESGRMEHQLVKLGDHQVRFIELKPMKVAYYQTTAGNQPEDEAWNVLYAWVKEKGFDQVTATRYFGFNQPGAQNEHGYEMWATVSEDTEPSGEVRIKQVSGGLYAVSSLYGLDIPEAWNRLNEWVQSSKYQPGPGQWLEEHFLFNGDMFVNEAFQLDLYYPVAIQAKG